MNKKAVYFILAAGVAWYFWNRSRKAGSLNIKAQAAKRKAAELVENFVDQTNFQPGSELKTAADGAANIVESAVDQTTFLPGIVTNRELLQKEKMACK